MKLCLAAIQKFVDEEINPALEDHGGYLTIRNPWWRMSRMFNVEANFACSDKTFSNGRIS